MFPLLKGRWFWEVLYEHNGGVHSIFSLQGFDTPEQARSYFDASELRVMQELQNKHGVLVDVQIIYKSSGELYTDGKKI